MPAGACSRECLHSDDSLGALWPTTPRAALASTGLLLLLLLLLLPLHIPLSSLPRALPSPPTPPLAASLLVCSEVREPGSAFGPLTRGGQTTRDWSSMASYAGALEKIATLEARLAARDAELAAKEVLIHSGIAGAAGRVWPCPLRRSCSGERSVCPGPLGPGGRRVLDKGVPDGHDLDVTAG